MRNTCLKTIGGVALAGSLVAAAMTFGSSGTARADHLDNSCGVHTLHGSYLFATHGWNIVGGVAQPKAIVEGIDFNGDGTLVSPFATVSNNGTILRFGESAPGSYTVNPDCTGTLTFAGGISFDIFVRPGGRQVWMIQTGGPVPAVFEGTATKVSPKKADE